MCGIIGGRLDDRFRNNIKNWITKLKHRGEKQGYGFIAISPTREVMASKSLYLNEIVKEIDDVVSNSLILVHFRKASIGKVGLPLTHPVTVGSTMVIHNGTNKDIFTLLNVASDTEGVATIVSSGGFDLFNNLASKLGVVFAVDSTSGDINLHIDDSRPLCHCDGVYASEPLFDGLWSRVLPCHLQTDIDSFDKLELSTPVAVTVDAVPTYCYSCGKDHLHGASNVCNICVIDGDEWGTDNMQYQDVAGVRYYADGRTEVLNHTPKKGRTLVITKGSTYYPINQKPSDSVEQDWVYGYVLKGGNTYYVVEDYENEKTESMWYLVPKKNSTYKRVIKCHSKIYGGSDFAEYINYDTLHFIDFVSVKYTTKLPDLYLPTDLLKSADDRYFLQPIY